MEEVEIIIDEKDEFIGTEIVTPKGSILKILGHNGLTSNKKRYYYNCSVCSLDHELYPKPFSTSKDALNSGVVSCECSDCKRYSKYEYNIKISRRAEELGHVFIGFVDQTKINKRTKLKLYCIIHDHYWETTDIDHYLNTDRVFCEICAKQNISKSRKIPDNEFIERFMSTGSFVEGTTFKRDENRKSKAGYFPYWLVYCPDCNTENSSFYGTLCLGSLPCKCYRKNQDIFYINLVIDNGVQKALKFGIETTSNRRLREQQSATKMKVYRIFEIKLDNNKVKKIEQSVKDQVERKILTKSEYPDGYTETTYVYNYYKILDIIYSVS